MTVRPELGSSTDSCRLQAPMRRIVEVYAKTRKRRDLFTNVWLFRPLAAPIVYALSFTRITPNQVTLASFVVALVAVLLLFWPGYWGLLAATTVFTLAYLLDCADGMLARWRGVQSTPGHLFDFLMDEIKSFFVLGAVSVRLHLETGDVRYLLVGVGGVVALATGIAITTFQRRPEITGAPADAERPPASTRGGLRSAGLRVGLGIAHLVVHYPSYLWLVGLVGRVELYFFPYVAAITVYALRSLLWLALRHGLR